MGCVMSAFITYKLMKLGALALVVFLLGCFGFFSRSQPEEQHDEKHPEAP